MARQKHRERPKRKGQSRGGLVGNALAPSSQAGSSLGKRRQRREEEENSLDAQKESNKNNLRGVNEILKLQLFQRRNHHIGVKAL